MNKVKCINTSKYNRYDRLPLTVGKVYDVIEVTRIPFSPSRYDDYTGPFYKLVNDNGEISGYTDECVRVLTLDEVRESHLGVVIKPEEKERLNEFVKYTLTDSHLIELSGTAKLSQNFFKKSKDGSSFINMCNMCGSPKFKLEVEGIKHLLKEEGFEFEKVEVEYAVYDTNVTHDAKWILGYEVA